MFLHCTGYCLDLSISFAEVLTFFVACLALCLTLREYKQAQDWKKKQYLSTYMSKYRDVLKDRYVERGMLMLDWNRTSIPLYQGEIDGEVALWFTDDLLKSALRVHYEMDPQKEGFTSEEVLVRRCIDEVLERLGDFYIFFEKGALNPEDCPGNIRYWVDLIGDPKNESKSEEVRLLLWKYIISYKFLDYTKLSERLGRKIPIL